MFDCMGCGNPKCYHNETYCNDCMAQTTRGVIVSSADYLGGPRLTDLLEPGESVYSTFYDPLEDEYHVTIRKEMN